MRLWQPTRRPALDPPTPVSRGALRFAILGGGIAWLLHLLLAYTVSDFGCTAGLGRVQYGEFSVVTWMLFAVTALTLGLGMAATGVAWRSRRRLARNSTESESRQAEDFAARFALITDALFVLIIAVQSVPIFYFLRHC